MIDFGEVRVEKLSAIHKTDSFDCGDDDINEFLQSDALKYQQDNLAVTFIFIYNDEVIGFFSCSTDSIRLKTGEQKEEKLDTKRIPEFPAVKIGRFGRDKRYAGQKAGERILKWAIGYVKELSGKAGIRYITIDSYPDKVRMYESFGFRRNLHDQYHSKENISMRLDIHNPKKE